MENKISAKGDANEPTVEKVVDQLYAEENAGVFYNLLMYSNETIL